jgi:hypothetical protein
MASIITMKLASSALFILLTASVLGVSPTSPQDALALLSSTKPVREGARAILVQRKFPNDYALFQQQLEAIAILDKQPVSNSVAILIPYLGYAASLAAEADGGSLTLRGDENLDYSKRTWPALRAILQVKDVADELRKYCLDANNPVNYRFAALLVLRYADANQFQKVVSVLDMEFRDSTHSVKTYFDGIKDGSVKFLGIPDIK